MKEKAAPVVWETDLPLFSRVMLAQWTGAMLATLLAVLLIMAPIFLTAGDWGSFGRLALAMGAGIAVFWLLGLLIMLAVFRGEFHVRYTLNNRGVRYEALERAAKVGNRAAVLLGALARNPGVAGAGLLAASRESEEIRWSGAFKAVHKPARHAILFKNSWRTLMWVQCRPDNYESVAEAVTRRMQNSRSAERVRTVSALPTYLGNTLLVSLACAPLFPLAEEFDTGLFVPIFIYCFALATVWLIPLLAYAVIGGMVVEALLVLADLARVRESSWFPGERHTGFEVIGGSEAQLLLVAGLGAAVLVWMSWRFLRGRSLSAWMADMGDMTGD